MNKNQEFDKIIKDRLESYRPVYQEADWLAMVELLTKHDKIHSKQSHEFLDNAVKHLN